MTPYIVGSILLRVNNKLYSSWAYVIFPYFCPQTKISGRCVKKAAVDILAWGDTHYVLCRLWCPRLMFKHKSHLAASARTVHVDFVQSDYAIPGRITPTLRRFYGREHKTECFLVTRNVIIKIEFFLKTPLRYNVQHVLLRDDNFSMRKCLFNPLKRKKNFKCFRTRGTAILNFQFIRFVVFF